MKFIDLKGRKFEKYVVVQYVGTNKRRQSLWLCRCDCGNEKIVCGSDLKSGNTKSCGCLNKANFIQRSKTRPNCWTKYEIDILEKFYVNNGSKFCSKLLDRTIYSIRWKAKELGLKTIITNSGLPKKIIIEKISDSEVVAKCKTHGDVIHYYSKNEIGGCKKCCAILQSNRPITEHRRTNQRKYYHNKIKNNPRLNFIYRIRNRLRKCYCGEHIHFKDLGYTGEELRNHFEKIKRQQENKCPSCGLDYGECKMTIEHTIPLATAKSKQEIIDLFNLSNLSLMCKNCNSSKNDTDYKTWKDNKREY